MSRATRRAAQTSVTSEALQVPMEKPKRGRLTLSRLHMNSGPQPEPSSLAGPLLRSSPQTALNATIYCPQMKRSKDGT